MFRRSVQNLASQQRSLHHFGKRSFQDFSKKNYHSGFEKMISEKLNFFRLQGHYFALFGVANLVCYGLSYYIKPENYKYFFSYTGDQYRFFQPLRAMMGSNNLLNVAWSVPSLFVFSYWLNQAKGELFMLKFFALTIFSVYAFYSTFAPTTGTNYRLI